jgi:hypothetical protein
MAVTRAEKQEELTQLEGAFELFQLFDFVCFCVGH